MADTKGSKRAKDFMLRTICNVFARIKSKWFEIGIQLGISRYKLEEFQEVKDPLSAVVDYWLSGNVDEVEVPFSWEFIVKVLKSEHIGAPGLAEKVKKQYLDNEVDDGQDLKSASEMEPSPKRQKLHHQKLEKKLICKIEQGDRIALNELLMNHSFDPKTYNINDQKETLLHLVCRKGHLHLVCALIEIYNCSLKVVDKSGNSPFHVACANKHLDIVQYFSCYIGTLPCYHLNDNDDTVLHVACETGYVPLVRVIIHDMFLSHKFVRPLKICMYQDDVLSHEFGANSLKMLDSRFQVMDLVNLLGFTPVHTACYFGHLNVIKFFFTEIRLYLSAPKLLESIPSLLAIACERGHHEIIDYLHTLSGKGINVYVTPSFKGVRSGCIEMKKFYEDCIDQYGNYIKSNDSKIDMHGKYINEVCTARSTPLETSLFVAARRGDKSLFKHLTQKRKVSHKLVNCSGDTVLHAACASCDIEMIEMAYVFLTTTTQIDLVKEKNDSGNTCLHVACEWGVPLNAIDFLVKKGFHTDASNNHQQTPLHLAIIHRRYDIFDFLLSHPVDINAITKDDETPLHLSTIDANLCIFAERIVNHSNFSSLNFCDQYCETPIFNACRTGDMRMLALLADHKECDLLAVNANNETIFNIACRMKMIKTLSFLFSKITLYPRKLQNHLGNTLLHVACCADGLEMLKYLAGQSAIYSLSEDINLCDKMNELTPLQYACTENDVPLLQCLLEVTDCDPDTRNKTGDTALHICCEKNFIEVANVCKEHCSITVRNQNGDTPLHIACKQGNNSLALILLRDMHVKKIHDCFNKYGDSVLHVAATRSNAVPVLKYIIQEKICDYKVKNQLTGNTPLHVACIHNELDSASYLLQLDYDEHSWYNNDGESPLCIAFNMHESFLSSIITTRLIQPWQFEKILQLKQPFKELEMLQTGELVDIPLPHFLIWETKHERNISHHKSYYSPTTPSIAGFAPTCKKEWQRSAYKRSVTFMNSDNDIYYDRNCTAACKKAKNLLLLLFNCFPSVVSLVDSQGCTVLHYLALTPCPFMDEVASKIIKSNKIDSKLVDGFLNLPLHFACKCQNESMIFKLLQRKDNYKLLHEKNKVGNTPPDMYTSTSSEVERYLAALGANISPCGRASAYACTKMTKRFSIGIIVLGNSSVGKTTLVHTLKAMLVGDRNIAFVPKPTTGIVTDEIKSCKHDYWYTFYDIAGQIEFEASHSLWLENLLSLAAETPLSSPIVFLLVVKGTNSLEENKDQINKWFSFIQRHVKVTNRSIHIALICSHADCFDSDAIMQHRKIELKDYLNVLDVSVLKIDIYEIPIVLNGLKTDTSPLNRLLRYLEDMFLSCKPVELNQTCLELYTLLKLWFPNKPCRIKDVITKIKECRVFRLEKRKIVAKGSSPKIIVPHETNKLIELLKQLHLQSHIMLMPSVYDQLDWWIINKSVQNILFSKVMSIFSPRAFEDAPNLLPVTHNTGVISSKNLSEIFEDLDLQAELLESYLVCMEFCNEINDEEVLKLITGNDEADNKERCFFFPGIIKQEKQEISVKKNASAYHFGWLLQSRSNFGLRFIHTLLLRLTFKFVSVKSESGKRRLSLWKNGMFWHTMSGINVLVEVIDERKVVALFQCSKDRNFLLAKLRSDVIFEIYKVLESTNTTLKSQEFCIYPPPTDFNDYKLLFESHANQITVTDLRKCFDEEPMRRSLYLSDTETVSLQEILGFDSYISLKNSTLQLLKSDNVSSIQTTFRELCSSSLEKILDAECSYEDWIEQNGDNSVYSLISQLDKYSFFKLEDI